MNMNSRAYPFVRSLAFLGLFLLLHYAYDWFPNVVIGLFSGIDESNFQHYKIGFYASMIVGVGEYALFRSSLKEKPNFWYAQMAGAILIPWAFFILWYIIPALFGQVPWIWLEIIISIVTCYSGALIVSTIQIRLQAYTFDRTIRIILWVIFLILVLEFTIFTFQPPWADVFQSPY